MKIGRKSVSAITLLLFAAALLCIPTVQAADTIRMGVAGAHSGDLASYGIPSVKAAELVAKKFNAKGGVLGKQVELVVEDDQCKTEVAVNVATKMLTEDVDVVLGHICSGPCKASLSIYATKGLILMSPSATNTDLTKSGQHNNFFRTIAPDDAQAKTQIDFCLDKLKAKTIAIVHDKGDYGKGLAEFAKAFLEKDSRGELVLYEGITPGAVDYSAVINKVKRSKADVLLYGGFHPEASKLIQQMRRKNMKTLFISDDGVKDITFIKVAGKYAEGVYATGPMDTTQNPMAIAAIEEHRKTYGSDPGAFFLNAYAAATAMLEGIQIAGTSDFDALSKTLRSNYFETPLGRISFDERGDAIGVGFAVYQVQDGQYVEIK
ncbi:branched-chain amino acid ABC transporter substrate-binding protein [uncultured Desulfosarcina sp.]|uniref:branched-chain amino acid ABC transporter substrate-binding protein n=1 Tax=uncultured Desulfosarcina sp. TaxID=218289 RepID=UPI0029C90C03|nr:branched-chain amino acid ABC transporter substrate-binding protein [uncultured Desulfosarcina sp.]